MTTTAHEDQLTAEPEPLRQPYDMVAILKRNVASIEVALKQQTDRAEAAEAELAKLREQKPVAWMHDKDGRVDTCHDSVKEMWIKVGQKQSTQFMREIVPCRVEHYNIPLYAAPVPAVPYGVDDEAANRIALAVYDRKNGINPEPLLYAINRILGEEVHPLSVEGRDALLQSAEVTK